MIQMFIFCFLTCYKFWHQMKNVWHIHVDIYEETQTNMCTSFIHSFPKLISWCPLRNLLHLLPWWPILITRGNRYDSVYLISRSSNHTSVFSSCSHLFSNSPPFEFLRWRQILSAATKHTQMLQKTDAVIHLRLFM